MKAKNSKDASGLRLPPFLISLVKAAIFRLSCRCHMVILTRNSWTGPGAVQLPESLSEAGAFFGFCGPDLEVKGFSAQAEKEIMKKKGIAAGRSGFYSFFRLNFMIKSTGWIIP